MNYYLIPASEIDARIEELEKAVENKELSFLTLFSQSGKLQEFKELKSKSTLLTTDASIEQRANKWADEMVVIKNEKTEELKQNCITDYIAGATEQQAIDMLKDQAVENKMDKLLIDALEQQLQEANELLKRAQIQIAGRDSELFIEIYKFLNQNK